MSPRLAFRRCLALKKLATCVNHPPTNVYPWTLPWIVFFDNSTGANSEEAWQKMAVRFPEEISEGFTIQEWEGFDVTVEEIKRD